MVIFSAAVPNQGGVGHINEQWQGYWAKKFVNRGFTIIDILRERISNFAQVRPYYRQNMLVYTKRKEIIKKYSEYVVESPKEYMLSETVDWIVNNYEKKIENIKTKLKVIEILTKLFMDGALDKWFSKSEYKRIGIYGMGDVGQHLHVLLAERYDTICFDSYNRNYLDYSCYGGIAPDVIIITLVDNVETIKKNINQESIYTVEDLCYEVSNS